MNAIRSYFTAAVAFLVVAIGGRVASSVDIVPAWKCCPADRLYDPKTRFCIPAYDDEYQQMMLNRLRRGFRMAASAVLESSLYKPPYCDATEVLVDVPAVEVRGLMKAHHPSSTVGLPPGYCFDLTPSDELVARTCRPRDQYCGRPGYTCVRKCCGAEQMYVKHRDKKYNSRVTCIKNEMPFTLSAYKTVVGGNPVGRSNNTVLPYYVGHPCYDAQKIDGRVTLTTYGNLLLTNKGDEWLIEDTEYVCLEHYAEHGPPEAADLRAVMCYSNTKPPVSFVFWVTYPPSVVCLVLTLIVYATLPYLRNTHGYYVMFYMVCRLVYIVCLMTISLTQDDIDSPLCVPFGYFTLFAILTTFCWLNVICFNIYWMLSYNNSINRNTSTSIRTIMYHIYCWGFSSICVSTGYLFQHSQHETLLELAPDIGDLSCFFHDQDRYGTLIFYWLPTFGMMTANLVLFLLTAIHCSRIKSELNKFKQTDSKIEMFLFYKEKFVMSIKLYLIMGIPFFFSKLSVIYKMEGIIMDMMRAINSLHGVFIFIIFVAKRKVIMDLRKKFKRSMVHIELTPINNITESS